MSLEPRVRELRGKAMATALTQRARGLRRGRGGKEAMQGKKIGVEPGLLATLHPIQGVVPSRTNLVGVLVQFMHETLG
jgi:hypothetical protein